MNVYGIDVNLKNVPVLDPDFKPMYAFEKSFKKSANGACPIIIAVERNGGHIATYKTAIHGTDDKFEVDCLYVDRTVKMLLWAYGGYKVYVCGNDKVAANVKAAYTKGGSREFDADFMARVYENPFEVVAVSYDKAPKNSEVSEPSGRHLDGCRIGFDAGGSDRKVSAVVNGESVYSEEVVWFPKTNSDPDYHYQGIVDAFKTAASKMPRVDAIGISSAGIYVDNRAMVASLFIKVPQDAFDKKIKDIYIRAAKEIGADIPVMVANDGDVTALAGAMSLNSNNVLGIAMGTSEAAGYVDKDGDITGRLNEFAFCPVDIDKDAMEDEWSHDIGCGVKYFSQDSVNKLAPRAGIELDDNASPAEKLKVVQKLMNEGDERARKVYESIGCYLGHTVPYYATFYNIDNMLLLGRVMSGEGGNLVIETAKKILNEEYPEIAKTVKLNLPDEKFRRVGQSVAAASLPELKK